MEHGLVRPSFVPPKPIRELRNLTRYRQAQIEERTREAQRLDKILQDAGLKLSSVATNILGVSTRAMLQALVEGTRDPEVLAELARGRLRVKIPALKEALAGRFDAHHALIVGTILSKLEFLEEVISHLSSEIEEVIRPFELQVELLETIPGVDRRSAESISAEIGLDMGQFGPSPRLASSAGMCPGNNESAGKHRSGKTRKGSKWLRTTLTESAKAAAWSKGTYFSAQHARLRGRRGPGKATIAVGHSILVVHITSCTEASRTRNLGRTAFDSTTPNVTPTSWSVGSRPSATTSTSNPWRRRSARGHFHHSDPVVEA